MATMTRSVIRELKARAESRGYGLLLGAAAVAKQQGRNRKEQAKFTPREYAQQVQLFDDLAALARSQGYDLGPSILTRPKAKGTVAGK